MTVDETAGVKGICRAIGDELKRARERKKASLADVAKKTKINPKYLQSIEEGEFGFLPEPYVRAFIRAYAQEVGLEPSTMLKPLDRVRERLQEARPVLPVQSPSSTSWVKSLLARLKSLVSREKQAATLVIGGAMVVLALSAIYARNYHTLFGSGKKPAHPSVSQVATGAQGATELRLDMEVVDNTWVQVVADDSTLSQATYAVGERRSWRARHSFSLKVADAGAVMLTLDGRPLGRLGEKGEELALRIDRTGIVTRTGIANKGKASPVDLEQSTVEQYRGGLRRREL
ncbi:MAG: DUF4115 domain-containing protein [bacterium]|nr:DUF4115 domain-containing protein [candidate division KSB1 bacterium]MDH7559982.1 DUF4115 domain-containing protein [bacterium]